MHTRQASLLLQANDLQARLAAKSPKLQSSLYKYTDPDGKEFYLPSKMTTVKSPYSGKSFSAKPEKATLSDVGKELKQEAKADK